MKSYFRRFDANEADFREMNRIAADLEKVLFFSNPMEHFYWEEYVQSLVRMQDEKGSFALLDSFNVPEEARMEYCLMPTFRGAAILMKFHLSGEYPWVAAPLAKTLAFCTRMGLPEDSYDEMDLQMEILEVFLHGGLDLFLEREPDFSPDFKAMMGRLVLEYHGMLDARDTIHGFGVGYRSDLERMVQRMESTSFFLPETMAEGPQGTSMGKAVLQGFQGGEDGVFAQEKGEVKGTLIFIPRETRKELDREAVQSGDRKLQVVCVGLENGNMLLGETLVRRSEGGEG
ncbi:hypothetical protein [Anaerotalea alkaliphila]|uniref:Uncharacterized protein n=1 Tax=Anaerotalea alkaliphila TaxID=2662126 RepID=A0A7X5KLS1_9FIRM|nr:hypothetical protein [Anaerotalea alkaliphila]NDL67126.1 hypothetical protein [Anaerotalea alkaliphila]